MLCFYNSKIWVEDFVSKTNLSLPLVASAAVRSNVMVLLLLIHCLMLLQLFAAACVASLFCYAVFVSFLGLKLSRGG